MQLCEKYRPRAFGDFIGQERLIRRVRAVMGREDFGVGGGDAFFVSGPTGTGKTSFAQIIARELGADDWAIEEIDGEACSVDRVRKLADTIGLGAWGEASAGWRVWIVNEAHSMTAKAVQAWLTLLERLPMKRLIVFTTTEKADADLFGNFTSPLLARCKRFDFTNQGLAPLFAKRAREIAQTEGMDGKPQAAYLRLVKTCKNSMRDVLQRIDAGEMMD